MNPLIHAPIDKWSTREKLSLASSVSTAGDQNWYSVSRSLKPFGELNRPNDWFSQKYCAQQYNDLLEKIETPRRKRGEKNEDTAQNLIVRKLTMERINELKDEIEKDKVKLADLKKNINLLKNDNLSETDMKIIEKQMLDALEQKRKDEEEHELWLKEREEKYAQISRRKSSFVPTKTPKKDDQSPLTPTTTTTTISSKQATTPSLQQQLSVDELITTDISKTTQVTNISSEEQQQQLIVKQEKLAAQEAANNVANEQSTLQVTTRLTRDKSKEADKIQIITINEDRRQSIIDSKAVANESTTAKDDRTTGEKSKDKVTEDKNEISNVQSSSIVKMEVDNMDTQRSPIKVSAREDERTIDETKDDKDESIASNKRKRTSTSINVLPSTTSSPAASATNVQQQQQQQQQATPVTQTRRSGRFKPIRQSTGSKSELSTSTPTTTDQSQQTKKSTIQSTSIDTEQQQPQQQQQQQLSTTVNPNQLMMTDDTTKDSTTSDLTDTYTSPNSPASSILNVDSNDPEHKEYKTWKRSILLLWREIATHKYSTLFTSPVTDDEARGYSTVVLKPIDLTTIKKKVENGQIRTTAEFQRDIMLMFQNAIMYNTVKHEVHQMTLEMQKEILESIEDFINNQKSNTQSTSNKETQSSSSSSSSNRRKSRTN